MTPLIDNIWPWRPNPTPTPTPAPKPKPEPAPVPPGVIDYLKAWKTLQGVPVEQLGSLAVLIPVIVFLSISGMVAWAAILLGLFLRILWVVIFGKNRAK